MSFGENLISLRKQMGWSQDDLANNLNLSRQAISKWENDTSKPDIDNVKKISKIFSVTIDDLLNNEVPKEKAVALDVKKQEKKERTITIVKLMIIAVIVLYVISVIYKFASLLIIVNGVQKYANLSNYHYVITTYDENGLAEKEECWFKDGVSKTVRTVYSNNSITGQINICVDFNNNYGYTKDVLNNSTTEVDFAEYENFHKNYKNGGQFYDHMPLCMRNSSFSYLLLKSLSVDNINIKVDDINIFLNLENMIIVLNRENLIPSVSYSLENRSSQIINTHYNIEFDSIKSLEI